MDLVTGAMGNLAPKLEQLLGEEYKLQKGLRKQVQSLSRKLETIHAVLRKVGDVPPDRLDKQVRIWCREVREASYDMEDVLDTFLISVDGRETADMNGLKRALKRMGDLFSQAKALHDIAGAFEDIKKQPQEVPDRRARPKIDEIVARPAAATSVDPRLSALYTKASQLVGIDEPRDKIIEMMSIGEKGASSKEIKIITIVGSGGLGKTTLAKAVYDKVNRRFDCSAFVRVGHNCGPGKVLRDILVDLTSDNVMQLDEKQLIDELGVFLKGKRYLIVLDDMWDTSLWEIIRLALYGNGFGSRIITTTRNIDLARRSGGCYILKPLSFESSTKLFYGRIFGSQGNCPTEYKELSAFCLRKCGGVPLAIIVISGLLTNKIDNIKEWYDVCASIGSGLGSNPDMDILGNILSRSYYDLPSHLKACLLYLSIYPENYEIRKDQLIWRWIAEGLIQHEEEGKSLYEIGESFFYELANRSLIQPTQMTDEGTPWACCVHDMVLDLICCYAGEENFVTKQNYTPYLEGKVRRLALHSTNNEHSLGSNVDLENLRSLNAIGCPMYVIPPVSSFKILRVLDLESCESMKGYDLKHLGKLLLLRFIGLRNTFVRKLPEEVGDLKFLQTLELEGSGVEELPASMATLPGLMCLNADWTTRVPDWIGKLTSVQQLVVYPGFSVDDKNSAGWFVQELGNLGELRVLRFVIEAQNEGQLRDLLKSLSSLQKIEVIDFDCYGVKLNKSVSFETADFSLCPNLRFLTVRRLEFSSLPASINPGCLPKLCHLWLKVSDVDGQDLEILGSFTGLVSLHLQIVNIEQGDVITCGSGAFQSLKFFSITIPLQFVYGAMPRLEVLDFHCNVRLLTDANHNFNFDFGLGNLHLLEQVIIRINCLGASPEELGKVEAAVNKAIHSHTNHPTSEIKLFGQHLSGKRMFFEQPTETLDADLSQILEKTDEPRGELIKMLLAVDNDAHDKKMKILSIVRSEGLGKTTLAQEVFDMLSPKFDCGSFVQVGKNADLRKVLTNILIGLDKQKYKDSSTTVLNLMELVALLRESLENKRFFVVVDDIWDLNAWDIIKCALIENSNGSAVLTTSRDVAITEVIGGSKLPPFSRTDSRKLFFKKLFGSEDKCPPELKNICEELIETCGEIQSVITEIVELLASVPQTLKDWQAVYYKRKLTLSYPALPDNLRKCLLYFSMFRKGYEISGERLIRAWIAEDLIQGTERGQTLQEVGESYVGKLVSEKMIKAVEVDAGGKALSCRVYGWVHDFIISKSTDEANFLAILKDPQDIAVPLTFDRLSIQGNTEVHTRPEKWWSQAKSLVVSCDNVPSISGFPNVNVMDLRDCGSLQADHLKGIKKSKDKLRYLIIGSKCIADIPKEITELKHLQTLDLSASGLNELPDCVLQLRKLESLWVNSYMKIPDGIVKMSALQELGDINITKPVLLKKLRKLSKLRVLRIAIWSWDWDESFKSSTEQLCDNLRLFFGFKENIVQSFSIQTCCPLDFMDGLGNEWAPPQSLQKLEIRHSAFDKLPRWFKSLQYISTLTIEVYKLSEVILGTLGKLPTLGSLSLTSKEVPEGYFLIDSHRFKKLESLKFASHAMKEMFAPQEEPTQQLKRLTIVFQASRTKEVNPDFSFGLENLCSLEHIRVEIICFNATQRMVSNAEAAISRHGSSHRSLEIQRLDEESMVAEADPRDTEQEQKETEKLQNKESPRKREAGKMFRLKRRRGSGTPVVIYGTVHLRSKKNGIKVSGLHKRKDHVMCCQAGK